MMIKRLLFSLLLVVSVFSCMGLANVPRYKLKFSVNTPFLLQSNARVALPAGEYWVKDWGTAPGHLLSLESGKSLRHLAWLNTVRIDRAVYNWRDIPTARFDTENPELPVLKEFFLPGTDGYEILSVDYDKSADFIDVASLHKATYTITERSVVTESETAPVEKAPVEEAAPAPAPEPEMAPPREEMPREEVKPVDTEKSQPIRERRRVRKD